MKIVNEVMLQVAAEIASQYGYIETDHRMVNLISSSCWGTSYWAIKSYLKTKVMPMFEAVNYSYPIFEDDLDKTKVRPRIELRVRFSRPRIDIFFPDGGFVGMEFNCETYEFAEAQIWYDGGFEKAPVIKHRIEELIKERICQQH